MINLGSMTNEQIRLRIERLEDQLQTERNDERADMLHKTVLELETYLSHRIQTGK